MTGGDGGGEGARGRGTTCPPLRRGVRLGEAGHPPACPGGGGGGRLLLGCGLRGAGRGRGSEGEAPGSAAPPFFSGARPPPPSCAADVTRLHCNPRSERDGDPQAQLRTVTKTGVRVGRGARAVGEGHGYGGRGGGAASSWGLGVGVRGRAGAGTAGRGASGGAAGLGGPAPQAGQVMGFYFQLHFVLSEVGWEGRRPPLRGAGYVSLHT